MEHYVDTDFNINNKQVSKSKEAGMVASKSLVMMP